MKKHLFTISILSVLLLATGCKQTEEKVRHIPTAPQIKARIDRSEPVKTVDVKTGKCARHRDGDPCEEYPVCDG